MHPSEKFMKATMFFCVFDTSLGSCGIAWRDSGIVGVNLMEPSTAVIRARMQTRYADAIESKATKPVNQVIKHICLLLQGKPADLTTALLDMQDIPAFHQRVYEFVRQIPSGKTLSYGEVAAQLGKPGGARAVGQAMGRNPFPIIVPCHRVLAANGKIGGFTANGGIDTKQRMLEIEGALLGKAAKLVEAARPAAHPYNVRAALKHLRSDTQLAALIDRIGAFAMEINLTHDLFMALARAIVYQQLHGKAAATIFKRVGDLFPRSGEGRFTAKDIMRCADDKLRGAGLSQNKMLALRDLAAKTLDGTLPDLQALHALDDETIIERLSSVRGIGRWTVEMLLIFHLGRPDVLPVDDFGVRKGYMLTFKLRDMPTPKQLIKFGEHWAPYRSVASWYLWRAADQAKEGK
jgi:methylated-DNA-[protein]-cysteine S-methyltransferase